MGWAEALKGKRIALFGEVKRWPHFQHATPERAIVARGGILADRVNRDVDIVAFGSGRGKGKTAAERRVAAMQAQGIPITVLTEAEFVHFMRPELTGSRFYLTGSFSFVPEGVPEAQPEALLAALGAQVVDTLDGSVDYFVVGDRRRSGKTADLRRFEELVSEGAAIQRLDERGFQQLTAVQASPDAGDLSGLLAALPGLVDPKRVTRALKMLQKDAFDLYVRVEGDTVRGVVKSQTTPDKIYACGLDAQGVYHCTDGQLQTCMGLQGRVCKHLLVLVIGAAHGGEIGFADARSWLDAASTRKPLTDDEDAGADIVLAYRQASSGELDWRPMQTVPEDFYAY